MILDIRTFILDFFTSREWATITLIAVFVLVSLRNKNIRHSILGVIKAFFHWKILVPILCAQFYLSIFYFILYKLNIWNTSILREIIYFSLFTSLLLIFKYTNNSESISSLKTIVKDSVKATLIIEFYVQIYTFSYPIELIIQFFLLLFYLMGVYNKKETKDYQNTYIITQTLFYSLACFLIVYSIYRAVNQWNNNFSSSTMASLIFPIVTTIAYWPFLYLLAVYAAYEMWFIRIEFSSKHDKSISKYRKAEIFKKCRLNLDMINFVSKDFHIFIPQTQEEFVDDLNKSIEKYKSTINKS